MAIKVQSANNTVRVGISTSGNTGSIQATNDRSIYYSDLARDWAIKMDGKVQEQDYSSKYYAQDSKNSAMLAIDIVTDFDDHVQQVQNNFDINAQVKIDEAGIWAEGTDEQVQALGGEHSAKGWADIISLQDATTDAKGIIQIATEQEADDGLNTDKAMTPALVSKEISDNVGRGIVLGFDGILENNVLTFTPADGIAYDLKNNYDYEIDLHFPAVGLLPDDTDVRILNGMDEIAIRNVLSGSMNATYGDLRQVCDYIEDIGWRWIFTARYKSVNSDRAFVMQATTVALQQTLENASEHTVPSTKIIVDNLDLKADKTNTLNKSQISNCILQAPHMIDLTILNGTLTLKAGSKVIVPYGKEAPTKVIGDSLNGGTIVDISWDETNELLFYIIEIQSDLTHTQTANSTGTLAIMVNTQGELTSFWNTNTGSNYYTSTNNMQNYASFPIAYCSHSSGVTSSIDETFQHLGYIGSTIWSMKGIKGLIPNGRNEDGTLNNIEFTTQNVLTCEAGTPAYLADIRLNATVLQGGTLDYNEKENIMYLDGSTTARRDYIQAGSYFYANNQMVYFKSHASFHALDYNDGRYISNQSSPSDKYLDLTLGSSGSTYTAPRSGWFILNKRASTGSGTGATSSGFGKYVDLKNTLNGMESQMMGLQDNTACCAMLKVKEGDKITANYTAAGNTNVFRFVYDSGVI